MKLKINDTVTVLSGDDAGREGKIIKIISGNNKVLIDGINTYKKHLKTQGKQEGGVVTLSRPIDASKLMLVCPHCKKPTRVGFEGTGKDKVRVCKKCSKPIISVEAATETRKKK